MPVGNCTDDDVTYTVSGPGGDTDLKSRCFRNDGRFAEGKTVRYFDGETELASAPLPSSDVIVTLHKPGNDHIAMILRRNP